MSIVALEYCLVIFGYMLLAGMVYDLLCFSQRIGKWRKISCFFTDFVTGGILGAGVIWLIIDLGGIFRWYVVGAIILGVGGYYILLHRIIVRLYEWLGNIIKNIWRILTYPFRKSSGIIKKNYKKVKKNRKKFAQSS